VTSNDLERRNGPLRYFTEFGSSLGPAYIVLDGDLAPPPNKEEQSEQQARSLFGPRVLWRNGWVGEDATWYGGRPRPRHIVLDGDSAAAQKGAYSPYFYVIVRVMS